MGAGAQSKGKGKAGKAKASQDLGAGFVEHEGLFPMDLHCRAHHQESTGPMPEAPPPDQAGSVNAKKSVRGVLLDGSRNRSAGKVA